MICNFSQEIFSFPLHFFSFILLNINFYQFNLELIEYAEIYFGIVTLLAIFLAIARTISKNSKTGIFIKIIMLGIFISYVVQDNIDTNYQNAPHLYSFEETLQQLNYSFERFMLQTQDGYLVSLYRLQSKSSQLNNIQKNISALFYPGINCALDVFIAGYEIKSMPFTFVNRGVDVWMLNVRGNSYDRNHKYLSPAVDLQFFEYTWEQMGDYDMNQAVKFIFNRTNNKVHLIGYSQGTAVIAASLAQENETLSNLTSSIVLLGPTVFMANAGSFLLQFAAKTYILESLYDFGFREFSVFHNSETAKNIELYYLCKYSMIASKYFLYTLSDKNLEAGHFERYLNFVSHYPFGKYIDQNRIIGTSLKTFIHYMQMYREKKFQRFNYYDKNIEYYGQTSPPEYDLGLINKNVLLVVAKDDLFGSVEDNLVLQQKLINSNVETIYIEGGHICLMINKEIVFIEKIYEFIKTNH